MGIATITEGGLRLSYQEETALNLMLRKYGGEHQGMALYRLGWAVEDNERRVVPICFHPNPLSYHLLSWEPPSIALSLYTTQLKEDTSKGTYNCMLHFEDENGIPFTPTAFIIEKVIPILDKAQEIAKAALRGEKAVVESLRAKKRQEIRDREKARDKAYDSYVDSVLNDSKPAFDGNPMSSSTITSSKLLSDIKKSPSPEQPKDFDFTIHRSK